MCSAGGSYWLLHGLLLCIAVLVVYLVCDMVLLHVLEEGSRTVGLSIKPTAVINDLEPLPPVQNL